MGVLVYLQSPSEQNSVMILTLGPLFYGDSDFVRGEKDVTLILFFLKKSNLPIIN